MLAVSGDEGDVVHAELRWPDGGSLVFGSTKHTASVHARVREAATGEVVEPPQWAKFGSGADAYVFTASDPEGNLWTFGTYRGADV